MDSFQTKGRLRSLPQQRRLATARAFDGRRVELDRFYVDRAERITGRVVAVAISLGGGADVLVLKVERWVKGDGFESSVWRGQTVAISLAQVDSIRTLREVEG